MPLSVARTRFAEFDRQVAAPDKSAAGARRWVEVEPDLDEQGLGS